MLLYLACEMPKKKGTRRAPSEAGSEAEGPSRSDFKYREAPEFRDSLRMIGQVAMARAVAGIQEFERDWRAGWPVNDLGRRWQLKHISDPQAKRWDVRQIRIAQDYRVALMIVSAPVPTVWFLHIFRRASHNQADYKVAIQRARRIREGP